MLRAAVVGAVRREGHHAEGTRHAHRSRPGVRAIAHHFPAHPNACAAGRERARERERGRARGRGRGRRDATAQTRTQTSKVAHRISRADFAHAPSAHNTRSPDRPLALPPARVLERFPNSIMSTLYSIISTLNSIISTLNSIISTRCRPPGCSSGSRTALLVPLTALSVPLTALSVPLTALSVPLAARPGCSSGFRTRSSCSSATATSAWRASSARRPSACAAAASPPAARTRETKKRERACFARVLCARARMGGSFWVGRGLNLLPIRKCAEAPPSAVAASCRRRPSRCGMRSAPHR
jgi:hypothetical protein